MNLIRAIESGKAVDVISAQIEKRQTEKADLESQLAREMLVRPVLTFDEVKFFFERFKNGDANDISFRQALIDSFVNKLYLYDGEDSHAEIYCNASEKPFSTRLDKRDCAISEPVKSSSMAHLAPQVGLEPTTLRLTAACSTG